MIPSHIQRVFITLGIASCLGGQLGAQSISQLNVKTGLATIHFVDERRVAEEIRYYGHTYGVDGTLEESWFFLMMGMHYQRIAIEGTVTNDPFIERDNIHQLHVPLHLGVSFPSGASLFGVRAYAGGHVSVVVGVDENLEELSFDQLTGFNPGWQIGVQGVLRPLTIDVQAVFSGRRYFTERPDSGLRGVLLLVGLLF